MSGRGTARTHGPSSVRVQAEARARQGWSRVRSSLVPIAQAMLAAGIAYAIGLHVLGHSAPFFAPVSAWIALGFTADRELRRVAELAVGVALGVGLGDLVVHGIGTGAWQVAVVLGIAALVGRLLDRGPMLTTQAGVQAIVIVGLPAVGAAGGPLGRWTDALVGGAVALAVAALTPSDPRRRPRAQGRAAVEELAGMLRMLARGMRERSVAEVEDALIRGRASQPALDEWQDAAGAARDLARVSPSARRHRTELAWIGQSAVRVDRAVRNARVLARRATTTVAGEHAHDLGPVADAVDRVALACDALAAALGSGTEPLRARDALLGLAEDLDPFTLAPDDWQVQSLVLLLRSLVVDLLEASGVDPREAREALPEL
ncbi:MAG TPA: FUSC family protein [Cellulomonas sp.]